VLLQAETEPDELNEDDEGSDVAVPALYPTVPRSDHESFEMEPLVTPEVVPAQAPRPSAPPPTQGTPDNSRPHPTAPTAEDHGSDDTASARSTEL